MIGYLLDQGLGNELGGRPVATLLTQVVVDARRPGVRPADQADRAGLRPRRRPSASRAERGWSIAPDGDGYRRVVASPEPRAIVELATIRLLIEAGVLVVCVGGGGIPVLADERDGCDGVEAVIDKDLAAALLADGLEADALLLLTDVAGRGPGWGTPRARPLTEASAGELREMDWRSGLDGTEGRGRMSLRRGHGGLRGDRCPR